jgi:lipoxygenase
LISPVFVPYGNKRVVRLRKSAKFPVAAISEDLMKNSSSPSSISSSSSSVPAEKPVKFKVRAVVTVRNKIKEDFKETFVKHLDAFTDRIGRNVVLELFSTEIDPSKTFL